MMHRGFETADLFVAFNSAADPNGFHVRSSSCPARPTPLDP